MSKNLTIKIVSNISNDMSIADINAQIKEMEKKSDKIKLKVEPSQLNSIKEAMKSFSKFQETKTELEKTMKTVFPNTDTKKLLNLLVDTPLNTGLINLYLYNKIFDLLINDNYKNGQSDLPATLFVVKPEEKEEIVENTSTITSGAFKSILFQIVLTLLSTIVSVYLETVSSDTVDKEQLYETERNIIEHIDFQERKALIEINENEKEQNKTLDEIQKQLNKIVESEEKEIKDTNK